MNTATADSGWRLLVYGSVYQPLTLPFNELVTMPKSTVYAELDCYRSPVESGNWTGVKLRLLLEKAGIPQQATTVEFQATDGYTTSLLLSIAMQEDVLIAYEKDGGWLAETTRLVIPGANGSGWISSITQIMIVSN
jgi:DMSO/TMAO reductase YedYZ molybdopterin-dependent catalytic subunit